MKEPRKPHFARDLKDRRPPLRETVGLTLLIVVIGSLIIGGML